MPNRTPVVVCVVLLFALGAALVAGGGDGSGREAAVREPPAAPAGTIARRVEALRGLRFRRLPEPVAVTAAQARREGLEDLDRTYPAARRRADEDVLKLLGLLEPDADLRAVSGAVLSEQVAGYYDPRTGRLRVVRGASGGSPALDELTLAHELVHALEDQRFPLRLEDAGPSGDRALARLALVEGTATAVMFEYAARHLDPAQALGGLTASALGAGRTTPLPPFVQAQLVFPYLGGRTLVARLYETAGGRWTVVDAAERFRPPVSTEQVLHPEKYLRAEPPRRVALRAAAVLGPGWRRAAAGTWGEWATGQLLGGGAEAERAAAGWGGDRYELWRSGGRGCPAPCTRADALVMRWRWDTRADEREFAAALARRPAAWGARPDPGGTFALRGGAVAVRRAGATVTLVFAPTAGLARRLAR